MIDTENDFERKIILHIVEKILAYWSIDLKENQLVSGYVRTTTISSNDMHDFAGWYLLQTARLESTNPELKGKGRMTPFAPYQRKHKPKNQDPS